MIFKSTVLAIFGFSFLPATLLGQIQNPSSGHYYQYFAGEFDWSRANAEAATRSHLGLSGHLATVTTSSELEFIVQTFSSNLPGLPSVSPVWIGAIQQNGSSEPSGGWTWITGEPFIFTNWSNGEPNNNEVSGNENAIEILSNGSWNDTSKNRVGSGYLVEFEEGVKPPLTMLIRRAVQFAWPSENGKSYTIQQATNVNGESWQDITGPLSGTGSEMTHFLAVDEVNYNFYRLIIQ